MKTLLFAIDLIFFCFWLFVAFLPVIACTALVAGVVHLLSK